MANNPNNFKVPGPCEFQWDGFTEAGTTTKDGVHIQISPQFDPVICDAYGMAPANYIIAGKTAVILATLLVDTASGSPGLSYIQDFSQLGKLASDLAETLTITDREAKTWVCKCVLGGIGQIREVSNQEFMLPVSLIVVPDKDTGDLFSAVPDYLA